MSTLSELLPAGSGGKNVDFIADGALTSGQTVALKTDGKVKAIANTALTEGVTTPTVIDPTNQVAYTTSVYDPLNKTVIIAYAGNTTAGYYIIGSFSGGNLTYTSPQTFDSSTSRIPRLSYDTDNNKVVIIYTNSNNQWRTRIGTPTATSITWGNAVPWNTHALTSSTGDVAYCPSVQKLVFLSRNSSNYPEIFYGTVSGTSVSYSTYDTYGNGYQGNLRLTFKPTGGVGLMTGCVSSNNYGAYITITTVSTNYPQFVTQAYFRSQAVKTYGCPVVYDSGNDRYLISFTLNSGSNPIYVVSTDAAGDFGSANTPENLSSNNFESDLVYISSNSGGTTGNFLLTFAYYTNGTQRMEAQPVDLSASYYPTFPTSYQIQNGADVSSFNSLTSVYDPNANKAVVVYNDINLTPYTGKSSVYTPSGFETNVSSFIGITDAAIADTATGSVTIKGGIGIAQATSQSNSLGSAQLFNAGTTNFSKVVYDSNSDRIVVIFADNSNLNYGTAIVGEVSGSSVQYGTKEVFNTGTSSYMDITFDSNSNRVVIAFTGTPANEYGTAIVGSVDPSDNSIDFGTASVYKSAGCAFNTCTFDSSNNKIVVAYRIYPSPQGIARVGTVDPSDNSISFTGAESVYVNGDVANQSSTFDSSNNKVVITFQDGTNTGRGTAIVGTVSGTGISFGSKVDFSGANNTNYTLPVTFDSNSNKIVVLYSGPASAYLGRAKVGTISGTAITFGSETTFEPSNVVGYKAIAFDSTANKVIIVYDENQTDLKYVVGAYDSSINGITFETPTIFSTSNGVADGSLDVAYDSSINRSVFAFRDESNSNQGTSQVLALAGILENLTPNSVYYVQNNGDISTTSASPAVRLGKALSSTSINLEFNS